MIDRDNDGMNAGVKLAISERTKRKSSIGEPTMFMFQIKILF